MKLNLKHFFSILTTLSVLSAFAGPLDDFVTTWKTDNPGSSNDSSITIPTTGGGYNYDVDWNNDGIFDEFGITGSVTHNFGNTGTYTIRIQGQFPRIYFANSFDKDKILSVDQWGTQVWTSMYRAFFYCSNLNGPASDNPDLSNVTDMSYMFYNAILFNQPIGNWNTSNVTNMQSVFSYASSFNQYIGNWNTNNVTNMSSMFNSTDYFNQYIGNWNTSNVTNMYGMFTNSIAFNQYIGNWNTNSVTSMGWMFSGAIYFNQDISSWNTSNVIYMDLMFSNAFNFNQNIGNWNTSNVTNMQSMFHSASSFNQDISSWNTDNVINMENMFTHAHSFNQDISSWNTSNVSNMEGMFWHATSFDQNIGNWNISSLTDASKMFQNATLSTPNYDSLLIGWQAQLHNNNVPFHGGYSQYCSGEYARNILTGIDGWTITDGGSVAPIIDSFSVQNACDSFVLAPLANGDYFSQSNGLGTPLFSGYKIYSNQTLYIFADNGICSKESSFQIIITNSSDTLTQTSCNPSDTGIVTQNLTNQYGCDSLVTIITDLFITSTYDTINLSSCSPIDTGVVSQNLSNQNFCDSIVTTITSLLPISIDTLNSSSCNPLDTGFLTQNLTNQFGCDSIVTTFTSFLESNNDTINTSSCNPADTGIVVQNLTNQYSCDSIVTTFISLLPSSNDTIIQSSCNPSDTGTVTQSFTNQFGCDSIIITITNLLPSFSTEINDSICSSEDYLLPDGTSTNSAGTYIDTFTASNSCDSIHTINLFVNQEYYSEETVYICSGENFVFPDRNLRTDIQNYIIYYSNLLSKNNCDSIIKTNVDVTTIDQSISKDRNVLTSDMDDATYQWVHCDNNQMIEGATNQSFTPSENGAYAVNIEINGCFDISECIEVSEICGDGDDLVIYPNPTNNFLYIQCDNDLHSSIINIIGKKVIESKQNSIDVKTLSAGVYYIQIFNSNYDLIDIKKFVKY